MHFCLSCFHRFDFYCSIACEYILPVNLSLVFYWSIDCKCTFTSFIDSSLNNVFCFIECQHILFKSNVIWIFLHFFFLIDCKWIAHLLDSFNFKHKLLILVISFLMSRV